MTGKPTTSLGQKVRDARKERRLTQDDLAATTFSKSYVSAVELGKIRPSVGSLQLIATRLGYPVSYFLDEGMSDEVELRRVSFAAASYYLAGGDPTGAAAALDGLDAEQLSGNEQITALTLLGELALQRAQFEQAEQQLARALDLLAEDNPLRCRLNYLLGSISQQQHKGFAAVEQFKLALGEVCDDPAQELAIIAALANEYAGSGRQDAALALHARAISLHAQVSNPTLLAAALWQQAQSARGASDLEAATRLSYEAASLRRWASDLGRSAAAAITFAAIFSSKEQPEQAAASYEQALADANLAADPATLAVVSNGLASHYLKRGELEQAASMVTQAETQAAATANPTLIALAQLSRAQLHHLRGEHVESDQQYQAALGQLEAAQQPAALARAYFQYGQALVGRGEAANGADYLERAYIYLAGKSR